MGTEGIEKGIVQKAKLPFYTIHCPKLVRGSVVKNLTLPFRLLKSVREAKKGLLIIRPDAVFSKGGYVSLPVAIAAKRLKIPVLSHESDLEPGLANRLISRYSSAVLTSFPETANKLKKGKYAGSPVREELFAASKSDALQRYGFTGNRPVLLVFGGGSGSAAVNAALRADLFSLARKYDILHICGKGNIADCSLKNYVQKEFETDMGAAYAAADIVLCRAGSNTLFEIIALKKRALAVPLANRRSRGDQIKNAAYFQEKGLLHVLPENSLSLKGSLSKALQETLADKSLAINLQNSGIHSGNAAICREIEKFCK